MVGQRPSLSSRLSLLQLVDTCRSNSRYEAIHTIASAAEDYRSALTALQGSDAMTGNDSAINSGTLCQRLEAKAAEELWAGGAGGAIVPSSSAARSMDAAIMPSLEKENLGTIPVNICTSTRLTPTSAGAAPPPPEVPICVDTTQRAPPVEVAEPPRTWIDEFDENTELSGPIRAAEPEPRSSAAAPHRVATRASLISQPGTRLKRDWGATFRAQRPKAPAQEDCGAEDEDDRPRAPTVVKRPQMLTSAAVRPALAPSPPPPVAGDGAPRRLTTTRLRECPRLSPRFVHFLTPPSRPLAGGADLSEEMPYLRLDYNDWGDDVDSVGSAADCEESDRVDPILPVGEANAGAGHGEVIDGSDAGFSKCGLRLCPGDAKVEVDGSEHSDSAAPEEQLHRTLPPLHLSRPSTQPLVWKPVPPSRPKATMHGHAESSSALPPLKGRRRRVDSKAASPPSHVVWKHQGAP